MPSEKFYHPAVIEGGEQEAFDDGLAFAVEWGRGDDQPYEGPTVHDHGVVIAGVPLDESGVVRLMAALRRARRQAFPRD